MTWNRRNFLSSFACFGLSLGAGRALALTSRKHQEFPCWSYSGDGGPDQWGHLHPDWKACAEGREQSPIALSGEEAGSPAERLAFRYQPTIGRLSDNAHTVRVDMGPGSRLLLGDRTFFLRQFHFHTPSEHLWSNGAEAGELHLVHVTDSREIAVLGVPLRPNAAQAFPDSFWDWLQAAKTGEPLIFNPIGLIPRQSRFVGYRGSLTMPPCTEGVDWLLAMEPMALGLAEQRWLARQRGKNARPVQPLGSRTVHAVLQEGS